MIKSFIINKYLSVEFLKVVANMSLAFLCLGFFLTLFEEINFFKDYDVGIKLPFILSMLILVLPTLKLYRWSKQITNLKLIRQICIKL